MWFHDVTQDHANSNARAGTPQNQITFEMLTGTGLMQWKLKYNALLVA